MDVTACDWLLGDFLAVEKHAVAQDEDQASLKERDERARERWKAESGFKNAFVTTVVMLPYRLQDLYGAWGTWRAVPVILWYLALLAYFARRRWMCGRQGTTRTILEGIFMGSQGDEADTKWLIVLQVMWAAAGQFWYLSMKDVTFVTPTLMLTAVHVPRAVFFAFLIPLNGLVHFAKNEQCMEVVALQCAVQVVGVSFVVMLREEAQRKHYHNRLASERGRIESLRARLWAEAQRATFRGMLDTVFDASCVCSLDGGILSSTPQMDTVLLGQLAVGANASGLTGERLVDFGSSSGERKRVAAFLQEVSKCTTACRIHASLARQTGSTIEVTLNGISVPADGEQKPQQVFIGLAVDSGIAALEAEEAPWEVLAASAPGIATREESVDEAGAGEAAALPRGRAESVCSAPPLMECVARQGDGHAVESAEGGDCLPAGVFVRVDGKAAPVRVEEVRLGQRVLCMDHLSGAVKYAEVVEVEAREEVEPELLEVVLEDGTEVQMTADHPVFADSTGHMRARDLQPDVNSLDVLKVVSVPVKSVRGVPTEAASTKIVSLSVHQPQRHSLFVAFTADEAAGSVAVASASLASPEESLPLKFRLKNTFIDVMDTPTPSRRWRRSSSLPLLLSPSAAMPAADALPEERRVPSSGESSFSHPSSSLGSMPVSSQMSAAAGLSDEVVIVLSKSVEDRRVCGWTASGHARLSEVVNMKRAGLKSMGSIGHDEGWCYPCLMENWRNPDRPCIFGLGCSRCHEHHNKRQLKKARYSKPRATTPIAELPEPVPVGRIV